MTDPTPQPGEQQPNGQPPYGGAQQPPPAPQQPYGAPQQGQPPYGAPQQGQPPYGAPQQGQPGYGAPQQGQPGYGAPQQGQPPYGAPQQGQQPHGAPHQGQPGYGAPHQGGQPPYGAQPGGQQYPGQQPGFGGPQQPYGQSGAAPLSPAEDKQWAMWSHFGGIFGLLPSLIIFLVFKDRGGFTRQESKEALNWQITWIIAYIGLSIITTIINVTLALSTGYGYNPLSALVGFIAWLPYLANLVFSIIGGVKVNGGAPYRYPVNFRFIK